MTATTLQVWTDLLAVPDYVVERRQADADRRQYHLTVAPKHRVGICPRCGKVTETIHQTRTRERSRDLSISSCAGDLKLRVLQLEGGACGGGFRPWFPV